MNTTLAPALADLIPPDVLAKAARLAFDTLVSILNDAKAAANERRIAALAVLRLAFPAKRPGAASERARSASEGQTPRSAPHAAAPPPVPDSLLDPHAQFAPNRNPTPARRIAALAGMSPVTAPPTPPPRLNG